MLRFALILLITCIPACVQPQPVRAYNSHGSDHIRGVMERCAIINPDDLSYTQCLLRHNATI